MKTSLYGIFISINQKNIIMKDSSSKDSSINEKKIKEKLISNFCQANNISSNDLVEFINNENRISKISILPMKLEEKYEVLPEKKLTVVFFKLKKMLRKVGIFSIPVGLKIFETPEELISDACKEEIFVPILLKTEMNLEEIKAIINKEKLQNVDFWRYLSFISSDKKMRKERIFSLGSIFRNENLKHIQHGATFIPVIVKSECVFRPIVSNDLKYYEFNAGDIILLKKELPIEAK